jgi:hypothetical protein
MACSGLGLGRRCCSPPTPDQNTTHTSPSQAQPLSIPQRPRPIVPPSTAIPSPCAPPETWWENRQPGRLCVRLCPKIPSSTPPSQATTNQRVLDPDRGSRHWALTSNPSRLDCVDHLRPRRPLYDLQLFTLSLDTP